MSVDQVKTAFKRISNMEGLVTGHRQVFKALERKEAKICFLASDCEEKAYVDIVEALCKKHGVKLYKGLSRKSIGEYAGQVRRLAADPDKITKVVPASACVIHNYVGMSQEEIDDFLRAFE